MTAIREMLPELAVGEEYTTAVRLDSCAWLVAGEMCTSHPATLKTRSRSIVAIG